MGNARTKEELDALNDAAWSNWADGEEAAASAAEGARTAAQRRGGGQKTKSENPVDSRDDSNGPDDDCAAPFRLN
jgi:hypothetical protein